MQDVTLRKGDLSKYGYSHIIDLPSRKRHEALNKAAKHEDPLSIYRKLNVLSILNRYKNPKLSEVFLSDRDWLKSKYL